MNNPEKLTMERYQVLRLVNQLSKENEFGVAPIQKLVQILTSERKIKPISVRVTVMRLAQDGYLENPLRGCWRLTEKGRKLLKEVEGES